MVLAIGSLAVPRFEVPEFRSSEVRGSGVPGFRGSQGLGSEVLKCGSAFLVSWIQNLGTQPRNSGTPEPRDLHTETLLPCNRNALAITDTELKLIAAAAIIGLSRMPNEGYSTPAAIGTPSAL